jgi:hypothetical protein
VVTFFDPLDPLRLLWSHWCSKIKEAWIKAKYVERAFLRRAHFSSYELGQVPPEPPFLFIHRRSSSSRGVVFRRF